MPFGLALSAFLLATPLTSHAASSAGNPAPFPEATFTEVVNDVTVSHASDPSAKETAAKGMDFKAPDVVQTGRRSRAQLTATDGTVARIGSNTVFSLEPNSRTINLKEGSVLFNSPKGIGGGTIVTNSATATVTGTTIIVTATADGGFKLLVLEGTATMKLANGQTITLQAGQMSFVLPASKGGGAGPVLNFDLKQQAQNSSLVNGFTVTLPSQNLIVDATQLQQQKIQSGQLTQTGQVVVGAASNTQVVLATVNTVDSVPAQTVTTYPDLVLGTDLPLPAANTFTTPQTITASQFGLPSGILPGDARAFTGLLANNVTASGDINLSAIDGLNEADILAFGSFTFNGDTISLKTPSLSGSGSPPGNGSGGITPDKGRGFTDFDDLNSTLNLQLIADKGFQFPVITPGLQSAVVTPSASIEFIDYAIDVDFNPTSFGTPEYIGDLATPGLKTSALATPAGEISDSIPAFGTQFSMTSVLADMDVTELAVFDDNDTGNVQLQSILGNVTGTDAEIEAGQDVALISDLGGINLTNARLESGENDGSSSNVTLSTSVGDIVLASTNPAGVGFSTVIETGEESPYSGTVNIITPGNISVSNITVNSQNQNLIAGGTLSVASSIINGSDSDSATYTYAGDTVKLSNFAFTGCSTINLYSLDGTLNANTSITVPGAVNLGGNVTWGGSNLTACLIGNTSSIPAIGLTSDNSTVQAALATPLTINSSTTTFSSSLIFANVLFSPSQLGEAYGDTYFAVVHGLIAGAVTINGSVDLSSLSNFNGEADLGAESIAISGCVAITPPDGATKLQVGAIGNISFASGASVFDNSSCFSLGFSAVQDITLNNTSLSDSMGTLSLYDLDGEIAITNGTTIASGSSEGSSGNLSISTQDGSAPLLIDDSTLSTYRGPIILNADNITIANLSTISAPCNTVNLYGGQTGITISNSTVSAGSMSDSFVNLFSYGNITITNNSTISSYTGTSNLDSPRIILTAAHTVTVANSVIQTSFSSTNAVDTINANNVTYASASQINMSARTINLSNINFPSESQVYLTSQNGLLAPSPNTNANPVVGDVNFIHDVNYGGSPAQNFVPTAVGGASTSGSAPIHISSASR